MAWPWETEKRGYTSLRIAEVEAVARGGGLITAATTDALETAAGFYASAFAAAKIKGSARAMAALDPSMLSEIGRDLLTEGESCWLIRVSRGRLHLVRSSYQTVYGGFDEADWYYQLNIPAPSAGLQTTIVEAENVIHPKYSIDRNRPWRGIGPLGRAVESGKLLAALEQLLGNEAAAASGYLLAFPSGSLGGDAAERKTSALATILQRIKSAKGGTAGLQLGAEPMDLEATKTAKPGIQTVRVGMDVPEAVAELREPVRLSVLSACGIPVGFTSGQSATNLRESYRVWVFARVLPLAKIVQFELSKKLNEKIELDFVDLAAADTQGRARAFKSLIDGGMKEEMAAMVCGFGGEKE